MALPALASGAESQRHARAPRQGAGRGGAVRTTTPLPVREEGSSSRCCCRLPEGRKIAPGVRLRERVLVIDRVGSVDLGGAMPLEQRCKRLVQKSRVRQSRKHPTGARQEVRIHGRADSCPGHAMIMPQICYEPPGWDGGQREGAYTGPGSVSSIDDLATALDAKQAPDDPGYGSLMEGSAVASRPAEIVRRGPHGRDLPGSS